MSEPTVPIGEAMVGGTADSLLDEQGHGVLSLATGNRAYGIPMSYGYDGDHDRIVMQFVNGPESKKEQLIREVEEATLTVYNYDSPQSWESVIVRGAVEALPSKEVSDRFASLFFAQAEDAAGSVRWEGREDVAVTWYALLIDEVSGRRAGGLPHRTAE